MAYFEIHHDEQILSLRKNQWAEFKNLVFNCPSDHFFKVKGKRVESNEEALLLATHVEQEYFYRKNKTHKKISVQKGIIPSSRVNIWIKR